MTEDLYPQEQYVINDLETLKVLGDSLRMDILETLESAAEPLTVKQIAARLNLEANNLYYHVRLLEKHALVVVAKTNVVSGIIEKMYRLRARKFVLNQEMMTLGLTDASLTDPISLLLEQTRDEIREGIEAGVIRLGQARDSESLCLPVNVQKTIVYLTAEQAEAFLQRLTNLVEEVCAYETVEKEGHPQQRYMLMTAFYPTIRRIENKGVEEDA